jgi:Coenzyme PQQ synthesis protein D (PqqD)
VPESRWLRSPDAAHTGSGDRVVVLDLAARNPRPQILEGVAAVIWQLLASPKTEPELVAELVEAYDDADAEVIARDVRAFLEQLAASNLAVTTAE